MLTQTFRGPESDEAMQWFMSEFNVKDYDDYKSKYPGNSAEHRSIGKILGQFEVAGVLVSQGLINEDLYFDTSGIGFAWSKLEKLVDPDSVPDSLYGDMLVLIFQALQALARELLGEVGLDAATPLKESTAPKTKGAEDG